MTKILIRILFLASVVVGGILFSKQNQSSGIANDLEEKKEQFQGSVKGISNTVGEQTQELTSRGQEVSEHVSNILEKYIKPTEETQSNEDASDNQDKPIYEETLDYGRYLYCQQVIKDYDNQHP